MEKTKSKKGIIIKYMAFCLLVVMLLAFSGCAVTETKHKPIVSDDTVNEDNRINNDEDNLTIETENDELVTVNNKELVEGDFDMMSLDDAKQYVIQSSSDEALEYTLNLKSGWNLGNTLETIDDYNQIEGAGLNLETAWCGVYTTKELIDMVKGLGFKTVRIPVSWHNHLDDNYMIKEEWLDRVQEVVDYAYDNDMYVILNIHHDVHLDYYYPDSEHYDNSEEYVKTIWKQLAFRFKDYDDKLIFEPINEPRLVGHNNEWWLDTYSDDCKESVDIINKLNQVFVDTVRCSGGNNINRYLLIPGYDSSYDGAMYEGFTIPNDIASNKLIVTVHAYLPYDLALDINGRSEFLEDDKAYLDNIMSSLKGKFIDNGLPVLIGEYGILNKNNIDDRVAFTEYYVNAATSNDIVCMWWDNNAFDSGETFGIINRADLNVVYPGIIDAIINNSFK